MNRFPLICATGTLAAVFALPATAEEITLVSVKDNTLIETDDGSLSLGASPNFFAGRVGFMGGATIRRGVLAFDFSEIPSDAAIESVSLQLHVSMTVAGPHDITLHRLLSDWGEGASTAFGGMGAPSEPGDATWIHTFYPDQFWKTPGGDFVSTASATSNVFESGFYTWQSTPELINDVQGWIDDPESNFGWALIGNESLEGTVKRFDTHENTNAEFRPQLTVMFSAGPSAEPGDLNDDGAVNGSDLGLLLGSFGECAGCAADLNGDDIVDGADLGILLGNWTG